MEKYEKFRIRVHILFKDSLSDYIHTIMKFSPAFNQLQLPFDRYLVLGMRLNMIQSMEKFQFLRHLFYKSVFA